MWIKVIETYIKIFPMACKTCKMYKSFLFPTYHSIWLLFFSISMHNSWKFSVCVCVCVCLCMHLRAHVCHLACTISFNNIVSRSEYLIKIQDPHCNKSRVKPASPKNHSGADKPASYMVLRRFSNHTLVCKNMTWKRNTEERARAQSHTRTITR